MNSLYNTCWVIDPTNHTNATQNCAKHLETHTLQFHRIVVDSFHTKLEGCRNSLILQTGISTIFELEVNGLKFWFQRLFSLLHLLILTHNEMMLVPIWREKLGTTTSGRDSDVLKISSWLHIHALSLIHSSYIISLPMQSMNILNLDKMHTL